MSRLIAAAWLGSGFGQQRVECLAETGDSRVMWPPRRWGSRPTLVAMLQRVEREVGQAVDCLLVGSVTGEDRVGVAHTRVRGCRARGPSF